jgi:hypothetical protein
VVRPIRRGDLPGGAKRRLPGPTCLLRAVGAKRDHVAVEKSEDATDRSAHPATKRLGREAAMSDASGLGSAWWAKSLNEVDREIARLATICNVRILDVGVIERVLKNDASVCGSKNAIAFEKLRTTLMMHYHVRDRAVDSLGEAATRKLVETIVAKLRERIGERLGGEAPGTGS